MTYGPLSIDSPRILSRSKTLVLVANAVFLRCVALKVGNSHIPTRCEFLYIITFYGLRVRNTHVIHGSIYAVAAS